MQRIILASNSLTRAQILDTHGVPFDQRVADFDEENLDIAIPAHFVYHATCGKMQSYIKKYGSSETVLCADTVVTSRGALLRKAKDKADARAILRTQSGSVVRILTCMFLKSPSLAFIDLSATEYLFAEFPEDALEAYLCTDEWRGKAGACMVEGFCKEYIKEVRGFESTAMGLCIEKLLPFLREESL